MASLADMPLALGRRPSPPDPRTLRLSNYTATDRPPAPRTADWMRLVDRWPLYRNDVVGDCTFVSCAHQTQAWTRYAGKQIVLPDQDVLGAYSTVTGWNPDTGEHDDGARLRDVLSFWRKNGIGGRRAIAYVAVEPEDHEEVRFAAHLFGGLVIGIDMPLSSETQFRKRATWRPVNDETGMAGSWGGHATRVGKYDGRYLTCTTWGVTQRLTWSFWDRYVSEAWAVLSPDWLDATKGVSPTGLCMDELLADLQRITAT